MNGHPMKVRVGRPQITVRRVVLIVVLAAVWCGLWGEVTLANVISGIVLAFLATTPAVMTTLDRPIRFVALGQCIAIVLVDLVRSTFTVIYEVLTPTDYTDESTIEVDVGPTGVRHLFLLVVTITLTPGTAVVDVDAESGSLLLHLLHAESEPEVRRHVERLIAIAERALPTDADAESDPDPDAKQHPDPGPGSDPETNRTAP